MSPNIRVAVIQMNSGDDVRVNLASAERLLEAAAGAGARMAALPENFAFMGKYDKAKLEHAEDEGSGPIQDFLGRIAKELKLFVIAGTVPLRVAGDSGRVWPSSLVYNAQGERIGRYDKIHLFDVDVVKPGNSGEPPTVERYRESATVAAGEPGYQLVKTPAGLLGLSVCYDVRFPELYRGLSRRGAELLCVPAAFTEKTGEAHWEVLLRARAIENLCYVLAPGQSGTHPGGRRTYGHSMIVDPWGTVLARRVDEGPGVVLAEIDPIKQAATRDTFPSLNHCRL